MKKLFAFAISTALFVACGDDNSSSAPEEISSSSEETILSSSAEKSISSSSVKEQAKESSSSTEVNSSDDKTESSSSVAQESSSATESSSSVQNSSSSEATSLTIEITQPLSYVDTTNKRYYYLKDYCALDHENDKYVWVDGDSAKGIVEYALEDYYDRQNTSGYTYLSYKISNDTLYKCIPRNGSCEKPMNEFTEIYVGTSTSILGTWTFFAENDPLTGLKKTSLKKTITITPEKIVTQETYSQDPFDNAIEHCATVHMVVNAYDNYYKPCVDEFNKMKDAATTPDTVRFSDNYWIAKNGNGGVTSFLNGRVFESRYTIAFDKKTNRKTWTKTAIYNGTECSYITSQIDYVTKETCETLDPAEFGHDNKFETANYNEFQECIKQFDLSK